MKRRLLSLFVATAILAVAQSGWAFDLTLLHVNDSHSYLDVTGDKLKPEGKSTYVEMGAWPRLKAAVDAVRIERKNVALLHAGDAVQGDLYFMKYNGKPEMEFLDRLGFTAMTLGNHEFDNGPDYLTGFLRYTKTPVVGANVNAVARPELSNRIKPYTIATYGDEKVGIIGLTTSSTAYISSPGPVTFRDEAAAARNYVRELEAMGVNKIVLLTHVGLDNDKKLAADVPGVDVIVGGHSHSLIGNPDEMGALGKKVEGDYPVVVKGADGNDVYVVTAWKWGRILGRLDVTFDDAGVVTAVQGKPVILLADSFRRKNEAKKKVELKGAERRQLLATINASPVAAVIIEDPASAAYLEPFTQGVQAMREDVIGTAVKPLPHIRVPGVTDSGMALPHGSLIAPVVCQSMLTKIALTGEHADIALQNAGGVRESVEQGPITVGTAYTLMPFSNTLVLLSVTGEQFKNALETGVTKGGGAFPYVAGARYAADMRKPEGERIVDVGVMNADGRWLALDPTKIYRLVTNSYLASGGDGYTMMKDVRDRYDTGFVDAQSFIEYVESKKMIQPLPSTDVTYTPAQ